MANAFCRNLLFNVYLAHATDALPVLLHSLLQAYVVEAAAEAAQMAAPEHQALLPRATAGAVGHAADSEYSLAKLKGTQTPLINTCDI